MMVHWYVVNSPYLKRKPEGRNCLLLAAFGRDGFPVRPSLDEASGNRLWASFSPLSQSTLSNININLSSEEKTTNLVILKELCEYG